MKLKNICVKYGKQNVIDDVSFEFEKNKIYGIVGKNGAGKTTIMKVMNGLISPSLGSLEKEKEIKIGSLIEEPGLFLDMTASDNLKMKCLADKVDKNNINGMLNLVGLDEVHRKKVKNFSLGMRQRLGIAMALIGEPDMVILDEPINGLDPQGIIEMRNLFLSLKEQKTIVISSHILSELEKICDVIIFIDNGRIVKVLTQNELAVQLSGCSVLATNEIKEARNVLSEMNIHDYEINDNKIQIYDNVNIPELVKRLVEMQVSILEIYRRKMTCEEYFVSVLERSE